ncbi:MAG: bifunctional 4-hydroxy-2-oxoglutarate aldolase/2-dehydro-3-deoxy-phosphogluconate aldolase [Planctomycetota bacterium]
MIDTPPPARAETVRQIEDIGLVAIIRARSSGGLLDTCAALADGGVTVVEVTMTTPGALDAIAAARTQLGDRVLVGVGSVLDAETAKLAVEAGARFVVSPVLRPAVIERAHALGVPCFAGAFTPTEVLDAFEAGSDVVKVFPANHHGPRFFRDILAPMPHLRLTPTGGVSLETIPDWFAAGARCVGVGSSLVKRELVEGAKWGELTALGERYVAAVAAARG